MGQLKRESLAAREEKPIRLVIAVPDTRTSRARLKPFAALLTQTMPAASHDVWKAIRDAEPLSSDGILFVRAPSAKNAAATQ